MAKISSYVISLFLFCSILKILKINEAMLSKKTIKGLSIKIRKSIGFITATAAFSGAAIASLLGIRSANSIKRLVTKIKEIREPIVSAL